jgi:transposase
MLTWLSEVLPEIKLWEFFYSEWGDLSPYSPELNLIEILWRRIKYTWLPFSAYTCLNALSEALETILSQVGSKYQITFA